ncbi:MAG: type II toxin-antitoxin system VapC family toxin [Oscillospiraceae bacterium]|nr:type II toxin-antitoxin system VapC family toxin [Oscillospiraceae bacterium]
MNGNYIVDTNVIIKLLNSDERAEELFDKADNIYISSIVAGELFYGAYNSTRKQENIDIFTDFLSQYDIVDINASIANIYGDIKTQLKRDGHNIPENDLWIAATAIHSNYTLITFDAHFSNINGLNIQN